MGDFKKLADLFYRKNTELCDRLNLNIEIIESWISKIKESGHSNIKQEFLFPLPFVEDQNEKIIECYELLINFLFEMNEISEILKKNCIQRIITISLQKIKKI